MFYTVFCECTLKVRNSVQREDEVSIIDEEESEVGDNNIGSHDLEAGNGLPVFRDSTRSSSGTVTAKNCGFAKAKVLVLSRTSTHTKHDDTGMSTPKQG